MTVLEFILAIIASVIGSWLFLSQVLAVGADRGVQMSIEQPVWSEMNEEQRRKVTIPRELIDKYLKNYGTGFIITRLGIFAAVFGLVLWLS